MEFWQRLKSREHNNFNLLRLLLALIVALGHGKAIAQLDFSFNFLRIPAVGIFFFLSGIFVSQSLESSPNIITYLKKRFARIYPAAWFTILFTIFVLGLIVNACGAKEYLLSGATWDYLLSNATLLKTEFYHTCLFTDSPLPNQINGSLWSLPYEVIAYVSLVIFALLGILKRAWAIGILLVLFVITAVLIDRQVLTHPIFLKSTSGINMAIYFVLGTLVYTNRKKLEVNGLLALSALLALCLLFYFNQAYYYLVLPLFCFLALYIGVGLPTVKNKFLMKNDISYGVYLLHFPLFQFFRELGLDGWQLLLVGLITTIVLAIFSWKFIEKPAMALVKGK